MWSRFGEQGRSSPERAELIIHSSMVLKCPENGGCFCVNASRWTSRQEHWEVPRTGFHSAIFPRPGQKCMKCACKKMLLGVSQVELIPSPFLFSPSLYLYIYRWQACGQQGISVQTTRAMPLDYAARSVSQRQDLKNVFLQRVCCLSLHQVLQLVEMWLHRQYYESITFDFSHFISNSCNLFTCSNNCKRTVGKG